MTVFFVCAGLLRLLAAGLAFHIPGLRRKKRISLGEGGDAEMRRAVRAHGNLIEWAPLCLLLIWLLHGPYGNRLVAVLAVILTVRRFMHAGGMLGGVMFGRIAGATLTVAVLIVASIALILAGLSVRLY